MRRRENPPSTKSTTATSAPRRARVREETPVERVEVKSRDELRAWLDAHHAEQRTVWLVTHKKPSPHHVPWSDVVDEALCYGYIDSLPRALDEARTMLRLSPRSARSAWSAINQQKVARLEREGRMTDAGRAAVERAKQNGSWSRIDTASALEVPDDLARELAARGREGLLRRVSAVDPARDPRVDRAGEAQRDPREARHRDRREGRAQRAREPVEPRGHDAGPAAHARPVAPSAAALHAYLFVARGLTTSLRVPSQVAKRLRRASERPLSIEERLP